MKNFIQEGRVIPAKAPAGGVVSGLGIKIGDLFGIPAITAAEGEDFELAVEGVYELPKAAVAIGEKVKVYWSSTNSNVTTSTSSTTFIGHAVLARLDSDTTVRVRLSQ